MGISTEKLRLSWLADYTVFDGQLFGEDLQNYSFKGYELISLPIICSKLDCWYLLKERAMRSLSWAETESCRGNRRLAVPDKSRLRCLRVPQTLIWPEGQSSSRRSVSSSSYSGWKEFWGERDFRQAVFAILGPAGLSSPVSQASVSQVCNSGLHWTLNRGTHYTLCICHQCNLKFCFCYSEDTYMWEYSYGRVIFSCL